MSRSTPSIESLQFLTRDVVQAVRARFGTPAYIYDESRLRGQAAAALRFPHSFGLTVRYAIKANPNSAILRLFDQLGLHFDASSGFEAWRAIHAGIAAEKISLSAQELPGDFVDLAQQGVKVVATSLHQLSQWGQSFPGTDIGIRFNPGIGSGGNNRTNVGGPHASFGIWHEQLTQVREITRKHSLTVNRVHTHIGSGSDPQVWQDVALRSLALVEQLDTVTHVDLGGGYKVGRMADEKTTDLNEIGAPVKAVLGQFAERTGRQIHLEIEPGTYLVANCGSLLTSVCDMVSTGDSGHQFLRTDTGLTEILRPAMYGSQHPLVVIPHKPRDTRDNYVVVGHCCETGDILTPAPGDPEVIRERTLQTAAIGDLLVIEGAGAYCSAMSAANYNSFPIAPEVLLRSDGQLQLIRRRQTLEEMVMLEQDEP